MLLLAISFLATFGLTAAGPIVQTLNGTYEGKHLDAWDQDVFLGMPYAQPPLGNLRFRWPQSINTSFEEVRDASQYGCSCMQYHSTFNISEDCLNLNVIRPTLGVDASMEPLPVLVWIYGGGLASGSTADPQYNLSGIVRLSQDLGQPIIAASMNYRMNMYGFLQTPQLVAELTSSNAGLLDQRMALQWIHDNIAAFGGDPSRVIVWGESAGAQSIGYHLFSLGGEANTKPQLFRGAIMESGGPVGTSVQDISYYAAPVENLTRAVGCWTAKDQLACLRGLSQDALFAAAPSQVWNPLIDGKFLTGYSSQLMPTGNYTKVPLLIGTNTDEGTSFSLTSPTPNTDEDIFQGLLSWRGYALTPLTIMELLNLYPNDPCNEPPFYITNCTIFPSKGLEWRRGAVIGGDLVMHSGRRKMCELYTNASQAVYSYRFDTRLWNKTATAGVQHFDNVAFSFQNITGLLGPSPQFDVELQMAKAVGSAYINFVYSLDPNPSGQAADVEALALPTWPKYDVTNPQNMVLNASGPFVESDTWRAEGIAFMNTPQVERELLA